MNTEMATRTRTRTSTFLVPAGTKALLLKDAKHVGEVVNPEQITTGKVNEFTAEQVVIDPRLDRPVYAQKVHGPLDPTRGGDYAAAGYYGFKRAEHPAVLLVDQAHVTERQV